MFIGNQFNFTNQTFNIQKINKSDTTNISKLNETNAKDEINFTGSKIRKKIKSDDPLKVYIDYFREKYLKYNVRNLDKNLRHDAAILRNKQTRTPFYEINTYENKAFYIVASKFTSIEKANELTKGLIMPGNRAVLTKPKRRKAQRYL